MDWQIDYSLGEKTQGAGRERKPNVKKRNRVLLIAIERVAAQKIRHRKRKRGARFQINTIDKGVFIPLVLG